MPEDGVCKKEHRDIISYELIRKIVEAAIPLGITKVRLTGGEPLVRKGIVDLVAMLSGMKGLRELTMTTNGILLPRFAHALKQAGMGRVNVSLDTLDAEKYRWLTRGGDLSQVLDGLNSLDAAGFTSTKINMVLMPEINKDEVLSLQQFCRFRGYCLQRIHHYHLNDYQSIDFSAKAERPKSCHLCNRIRVTADGMLKPCLFSEQEILIDPDDITSSLIEAIREKPLQGQSNTSRENWQIGG